MLGIIIAVIIGAAILGIIIAVMEGGEFPGWGKMVMCVLATAIPSAIVNYLVGPDLFFVGYLVGAICGGFAIAFTTGMSVKRSCIAAGIYFVCQIVIGLVIRAVI